MAATLYGITALASLVLGITYLVKASFMPYHEAAIAKSWPELSANTQVLILALMRVAGGGWIAMAFIISALILKPFWKDQQWALITLPVVILLFYLPNLWATLSVAMNTPGEPPWYGNFFSCLSAVIGFLLYPRPSSNTDA